MLSKFRKFSLDEKYEAEKIVYILSKNNIQIYKINIFFIKFCSKVESEIHFSYLYDL